MCSLGHVFQHEQWEDNKKILYYGFDKSVPDFIEAQGFEVHHVKPGSNHEYQYSVHALCICHKHHIRRRSFIKQISKRSGIPEDSILQYQISAEIKHQSVIHHWRSNKLPKESQDLAAKLTSGQPKPWILLHPFSFQSNTKDRHWPHWDKALEWFACKKNCTIFLTGVGWQTNPEWVGETTVDLVDKTRSNNDVLALQQLCDLTVTTSNNLSHYAVLIDKPVINCINQAVVDKSWYFRKWYHFDKAMFVEHHDPLKKLQGVYLSHFDELSNHSSLLAG